MPVNLSQAKVAMREVLKKYAVHLPSGLASKVRSLDASKIFRILPGSTYRPHFDEYYRNFFAAINAKAFGTKFVIGVANDPAEVCGSFNCPAFCAPAVNPLDRVIYVNQDMPITFGTLYHEFIHYLEHGNFYPEFYSMGGNNPKIVEGVTEYLTRNVSTAVKVDREKGKKYQEWLNDLRGAMQGGGHGELSILRFAFHGEYVDLHGLGGVKPLVS